MEKDSGKIFSELKKDVTAYMESKLELLKLSAYERTGKVISVLSYGLILLFLGFFAILFIFMAVGFFLGEWLGSSGAGLGIVALLYLLLIGIILLTKDRIRTKIINEVIAALSANDDKNETNYEQAANPAGETDF
ncbi:phage holin family protein [Parabacteroides sp.]|uniref:phage holin family protein n=1 Tax=Parabacteroides sp. TaxID=1869337 RepID=UPI00257BA31F|nr:phage holin family protein [Parabacteroides sp.]